MSRAQLTSTVEQNTGGAVAPFVAGKNKIINGDFAINQRAFSSTTTQSTYMFDRWPANFSVASGTTTYTAQPLQQGQHQLQGTNQPITFKLQHLVKRLQTILQQFRNESKMCKLLQVKKLPFLFGLKLLQALQRLPLHWNNTLAQAVLQIRRHQWEI